MEKLANNISSNEYGDFDEGIRLSEVCFLIYWSLMLFGRAIGWYEGQLRYNILLVVAILFWGVKMLLTKYSVKEWIAIVLFCFLAGLIYFVSGEKGIVVCAITMLGVKNVSIKRIFKIGVVVWGLTFTFKFVYSLINLNNMVSGIYNKNYIGYIRRIFMGYSHPNVFHISYLMLVILIVCFVGRNVSNELLFLLFWGNVVIFSFSISFTGFLITSIYLTAVFFLRNKGISRSLKGISFIILPILLAISLLLPKVLKGGAFYSMDKLFNHRFEYANHYLSKEYLKLFGNNLALITDQRNTMDNSYVFSLVVYGIIMFSLICFGYIWMINRLIKKERNIELITTLCLLIGGISEPYLFNMSFKNVSLLFLGMCFFEKMKQLSDTEFGLLSGMDINLKLLFVQNIKNVIALKVKPLYLRWKISILKHRKARKYVITFWGFFSIIYVVLYLIVQPPKIVEGYGYVLYFDMIRNIVTFVFFCFLACLLVCPLVLGAIAGGRRKNCHN